MPTKEQIINNIREYSAADIVQAIQNGEVSLYELSKSGVLTPLMKKRIEDQLTCTGDNGSINDSQEKSAEPIDTEHDLASDDTLVIEQETTDVLSPIDNATNQTIDISETVASPISGEKEHSSFISSLFSFKGRMRRLHYFLSIIGFYAFLLLSVFFISELSKDSVFWGFLGAVIMFFSVWFIIAARIKRCHDRGNSGWWQLYTCIPYVGAVFSIILLFGSGDEDENEYGLNPRN